jgi:TrmH family RNA methyltransferase
MQPQITSPSNERIKHARRVRDGREPDLIFVDGLRLAEEAVRSGIVVEAAFVASGSEDDRLLLLVQQLTTQKAPILWTQREVLDALSDTVQSQGIVLIARRPVLDAARVFQGNGSLFLGLDRIQDPGNMGTLLRTAEAAGVAGVIVLGGSVDVFSPKVLRSSMGSAFRLPVMVDVSAEALLNLRSEHDLHLVAAAGEGELDYTDYGWRQPTLLLLGNEGRGVSPDLMAACDTRLRIPMENGVESLNVAAAGAVMLFEAARQRRL